MTVKRRCFGCRAVLCSGGEAVKKSVCIGILCVLAFCVSLDVGLKLGFMQTNAERYAELWKIKLPQGMTEVYSAHSKDMALGDGVRYTAFEAEKADTFSTFVQENVEFPQDELETTLKQIGVPEESMPPFEENLSGKILEKEDGSRLYILVSTQEKRVYFVQITV